jgi:hypothetical protein
MGMVMFVSSSMLSPSKLVIRSVPALTAIALVFSVPLSDSTSVRSTRIASALARLTV